jgi:hypothetical protein
MTNVYEGGCLCGAVRYRVTNAPMRTHVCHCTFCQRRTGSAFAFMAYFKQEDVVIIRGMLKAYEHRSDESNRLLRIEFCPSCGTAVSMTVELLPGTRGISGGTFDDPSWLKIERHIWTRSAQPWVVVPSGIEKYPKGSTPQPLQAPR